ncbi:iron-containing alcohol dehydrogenase [Streptomyces sp. NPDC058611]|uniref:iron-containing alcohol dehydrogenase n=1 Tax=unclassified Streptomyces TaxID=2593676 RepID=UPI003662B2DF
MRQAGPGRAGNVPAYVHKSAKLGRAVHDIVLSKAFDNGMICASEQAVILDQEVYEAGIAEFRRLGAHVVSAAEKTKLEQFVFGTTARAADCSGAKLNPAVVGRSPRWIAEQAGFTVPDGTSLLLAECGEVGDGEPLTREKLSPVLAALKASGTEHGLELAAAMVEFHGLGHSAAIHAEDEELVEEFGRRVKAIRVIANSPSTFGGIGDVCNAFLPSLTLGCGSYGHNSVSNNVTAVNLVNIKRIGRRNNNVQRFKVPPKIYFERNSIRYLGEMDGISRVSIVTDRTMVSLGFVQRVTDILQAREGAVAVQVIDNVEPNPELATVRAGAALMREFRPDTIIGLGGGSPMDAAKIMWLMYEHPEVEFGDTKEKFFDIRKRAYTFPSPGGKAKMVAVPTTSGTGSEVTPFAVISDPAAAQKYPLADYALTPDVAIVDPVLPMGLPAATPAEGVEFYARAVEELRTKCGIPASFAEEGVDERAFVEALPAQAMNAYADQCAPANPRMPMIDDMRQLMRQAYYGNAEGAPAGA